jgi:hypothetical protein
MIVSSKSTSTGPSMPATSGVRPASPFSSREATASSWRTCPKLNARRNEPNVEGA